MSKPIPVLCISREYIETMDSNNFSILDIPFEEAQFINRKYVDDLNPLLGFSFPQLIPTIVIKNERGEYLTYERVGSEQRLHNLMSLSIGGHVDLTDLSYPVVADLLCTAVQREIDEELGVQIHVQPDMFTHLINLPVDEVSKVHVGLVAVISMFSGDVTETDEIPEVVWQTKEQLESNLYSFEAWGQHIIKEVL